MTVLDKNFQVCLAKSTDGTFLAATNHSPYFCFEADSEDAALKLIREAIVFFAENRSEWVPSPVEDFSVKRFITQRVLSAEEIISSAA